MMTTSVLEPSVLGQLSDAIARSLKRPIKLTPMVYEQNECVVVEMPAPRVPVDEIELHLEGDYTLVIGHSGQGFYARVALPARVSVADSVAYCLGGILSMTFLKADAVEELEVEEDPAVALEMAIG
ncbi:MAG: Hsp20/alpha crystallin family protein [Anaerolineae bacterium]|nr:Hsp20/alpha crystallin family protein [Anaerolineae bacterium]